MYVLPGIAFTPCTFFPPRPPDYAIVPWNKSIKESASCGVVCDDGGYERKIKSWKGGREDERACVRLPSWFPPARLL